MLGNRDMQRHYLQALTLPDVTLSTYVWHISRRCCSRVRLADSDSASDSGLAGAFVVDALVNSSSPTYISQRGTVREPTPISGVRSPRALWWCIFL